MNHPYPGEKLWLCGVGTRRKLLFTDSACFDALTGERLRDFEAGNLTVAPGGLGIEIEFAGGKVSAWEDDGGVWLQEGQGEKRLLGGDKKGSFAPRFPTFEGHPHAPILRILAHEIAVNITHAGPLPNLLVYDKPWHRDAAMMALVLEKSGNLPLLEPWLARVQNPFDRNNAGHEEPDNLGQMLVILALLEQPNHPLRETILKTVPQWKKNGGIEGLSDFAPRPVYQTKWLKWGLEKLALEDRFQIPRVYDQYSQLFWMNYRDQHIDGARFPDESSARYPYLKWAEAHFYDEAPPLELCAPLENGAISWEAHASESKFETQSTMLPRLSALRCSAPHTWHGAEMFAYWWDKGHKIS